MTTQNNFQESLNNPREFTITYELVPGQGSGGHRIESLLDFARQAKADGRIKALSITDNPGGHPALAPVAIGTEVRDAGIEPLIHFSLKDKNRNQVESHIFHYDRQKLRTLLVMGGDYPRSAYYGQAKPVFDLDSAQTIQLLRDMKDGTYKDHLKHGGPSSFASISTLKGCVVSPFKITEAEQVWQYAKLLKKVTAGADFIVTQLGYDICKLEELITFIRAAGIRLPVLANVFIPSLTVARIMARGGVPGINFPEKLVARMEADKENSRLEKGRLQRAAQLICFAKQTGYAGVHIGGNGLDFEKIRDVLDMARDLRADRQQFIRDIHFPVPGTWYLYEQRDDNACGTKPRPLAPGRRPGALPLHNLMHNMLFSQNKITGRLFAALCQSAETAPWSTAMFTLLEKIIKSILFSCKMCGDCTLPESTYLCPQSGCPKKLTNGPCGGSRAMACEVFPQKRCFWVRVYERLPRNTNIEILGNESLLPPKDWAFDQSSSWINHFQGRDHCALRNNNKKTNEP